MPQDKLTNETMRKSRLHDPDVADAHAKMHGKGAKVSGDTREATGNYFGWGSRKSDDERAYALRPRSIDAGKDIALTPEKKKPLTMKQAVADAVKKHSR